MPRHEDVIYHVGAPVTFSGYVDDFERGIAVMEFSLDNGATWSRFAIDDARTDAGIRWSFAYTPREPGIYLLKARTVSTEGNPSPVVSSQAFEVLP